MTYMNEKIAASLPTIQEVADQFRAERHKVKDIRCQLRDWAPVVEGNDCMLMHKESGQTYAFTRHALTTIGQRGTGFFTAALHALREPVAKSHEESGEARTEHDAQLLADYMQLHLFHPQRVDQDKEILVRTWDANDGTKPTVRAMMSHQYAIIDNIWALNVAADAIPDGRVIRRRGDVDDMSIDIMLIDTWKDNPGDSGYGALVNFRNSEIGRRSLSSTPGVFRDACTNGMLFGLETGIRTTKRHRGAVDFSGLSKLILERLQTHARLAPGHIDTLVGTRQHTFDMPIENVVAQAAQDTGLTTAQARGVLDTMRAEYNGNTQFHLVNAMTRYAQQLNDDDAVKLETAGGDVTETDWDRFKVRAANISQKKVEKLLVAA